MSVILKPLNRCLHIQIGIIWTSKSICSKPLCSKCGSVRASLDFLFPTPLSVTHGRLVFSALFFLASFFPDLLNQDLVRHSPDLAKVFPERVVGTFFDLTLLNLDIFLSSNSSARIVLMRQPRPPNCSFSSSKQ